MKSFDDIRVARPALAKSYLELLVAQPGRPIALFAPRRVGKTFFLDHDLTPQARKLGFVPVYADLWLYRNAPLEAINHALEEALDDLSIPTSRLGQIARTRVNRLGALGASLDLGDSPRRRQLPQEPALRLDTLVARVAGQAKSRLLLMLDEIQALGEQAQSASAIATLRAVLHKRAQFVSAVFTGSSQDALAAMTVAAGGPMYQFVQLLDFPVLGMEYLNALAQHFAHVHAGKELDVDALARAFRHIGYKPALMRDLVKAMSAEGINDVDQGLSRFTRQDHLIAGWRAVLEGQRPLERALLQCISQGAPPMGKATLEALSKVAGVGIATLAKVRSALERLRRAGVLARAPGSGYLIEDPLFADYVAGLPEAKRSNRIATSSPAKAAPTPRRLPRIR